MNNSRRVLNKVRTKLLTKFYAGRHPPSPPPPPRSHPLSFYTPFLTEKGRKGIPFIYLVLTNATPVTYLGLEHCILLLWIHCLENLKKSQNQEIFSFLLALLGLFTDGNNRFGYPLYTSTGEIPFSSPEPLGLICNRPVALDATKNTNFFIGWRQLNAQSKSKI